MSEQLSDKVREIFFESLVVLKVLKWMLGKNDCHFPAYTRTEWRTEYSNYRAVLLQNI